LLVKPALRPKLGFVDPSVNEPYELSLSAGGDGLGRSEASGQYDLHTSAARCRYEETCRYEKT